MSEYISENNYFILISDQDQERRWFAEFSECINLPSQDG